MTCSWHAGSGMCSGACCWRSELCASEVAGAIAIYECSTMGARPFRKTAARMALGCFDTSLVRCHLSSRVEFHYLSTARGHLSHLVLRVAPFLVWRRVNRRVEASSLERPSRSTGPGFAQRSSSLIRLEGCPSLSAGALPGGSA